MLEPNAEARIMSRMVSWICAVTRRLADRAAAWVIDRLPTKRNW